VRAHLALDVDGTEPLDHLRRHHLRHCPHCLGEWRALDRQRRSLGALSTVTVPIDPDLWSDVVAAVEARLAHGRRRVRQVVVTSGGLAAVAAGVASWVHVARRSRFVPSG
jgi:hypothetical protein